MYKISDEVYYCSLTNKEGKVVMFSTSIPAKTIAVTDEVRENYGKVVIAQLIKKRPDFNPIKARDIKGSLVSVSFEHNVLVFEKT
jgi:hypothetical protein